MSVNFTNLFNPSKNKKPSLRDKFLSRLFGIFNEEIVNIWVSREGSPYTNEGRPAIIDTDGKRYTLDFTFRSKSDPSKLFICEAKCELEYDKYQRLLLENLQHIENHNKPRKRAFQIFLEMAQNPSKYRTKVDGDEKQISGSILIWGSVNPIKVHEIKSHYGFADILSIENMINDLVNEQNQQYVEFLEKKFGWCEDLFKSLGGRQ
jgi:hypothetical protein